MDKLLQKLTPRIRRRLLIFSVLFWIPVLLFIEFAEDVSGNEPILIDEPIANIVWSFSSTQVNTLMQFVTHGGDTIFIVVVTAMLATLLFYKRSRQDMLAVLISVGGAGLINVILKLYFQRDRPSVAFVLVHEASFSFPSGHAMGSSALGFTLVIMLWRTKWRWLAVLLATFYISLVGFSRIYLGAHYASDVIAGWCVSAAWVLGVYAALEHPAFVQRSFRKIRSLK